MIEHQHFEIGDGEFFPKLDSQGRAVVKWEWDGEQYIGLAHDEQSGRIVRAQFTRH